MTPDWAATPEAVPYANLDNPQSLNLYSYVQNNPVSGVDPDGHYRQAPSGTAGGNCGYPCTVTGQGGRVLLVNRLKGLGLLLSVTQEASWQQTKQMVTAPFFLWFRGWGNFLLNGKATGLGMVAAGLAGALPGDEEIAGAEGVANPVGNLPRVGSALKDDAYHAFPDIIDNYASGATKTVLPSGATLYQLEGTLNGVEGRFEWIVDNGAVTHRLFVQGGTLNGVPTKP